MPGIVMNPTLAAGVYPHVTVAEGQLDGYPDPYRVEIKERAGQTGQSVAGRSTAKRVFEVIGTWDPAEAIDGLENGPLPIDQYRGLYRGLISYEQTGPLTWELVVDYDERNPNPSPGDFTVDIDTTGASILQSYAFDQTAYSAPGQTATNFGKAIDVQGGNPKGTQRVIPVLKINMRARIATDFLGGHPLAYSKLCSSLTGWTNSTAMFDGHFDPGELLFLGATGPVIAENPQLTFSFLASQNLTGFSIGDITGINKAGHEFIWYEYAPDVDNATGRKSTKIVAAHVSKVYGQANLGQLKIGEAAP